MGLSNPLSMVELAGQEEPAVRQSIVFTVVLHITGHHARLQHSQAGQCPTPISPIERPVVRRMRQMTSSMIGVTTVNMFAAPRLANARRLCPNPGRTFIQEPRVMGDGQQSNAISFHHHENLRTKSVHAFPSASSGAPFQTLPPVWNGLVQSGFRRTPLPTGLDT
ncbi:hypothetical protein VB005_08551 [Metarhizium brunneum]